MGTKQERPPESADAAADATDALAAPVLVCRGGQAIWLDAAGAIETLSPAKARRRIEAAPAALCHAPATFRRLGLKPLAAFDVLELFAFVHPGVPCVPTPAGLAARFALAAPAGAEDEAVVVHQARARLLADLAGDSGNEALGALAMTMARAGWGWGIAVLRALGIAASGEAAGHGSGLAAWRGLAEWREAAPPPPPGTAGLAERAIADRLTALLGPGNPARAGQHDYARAVGHGFQPREAPELPNAVLAEAGTGIGKTLGYLAPAAAWADANDGTVWISTFTKNLQRQVEAEARRAYPADHPAADPRRPAIVVRKGRENYLCLLNFEDAAAAAGQRAGSAVALGLMARWLGATASGDLQGPDFPAWLPELLGRAATVGLADRRGECVYSACPHYRKCFIERSIRQSREARIVIANHALVMIQAALAGEDDLAMSRLVFDEAHHVFAAADNAFAVHLGGREGAELRRWLIGGAGRGRARSERQRGLAGRIGDLVAGDEERERALADLQRAARCLPAEGWQTRIAETEGEGAAEAFLARVRRFVLARAEDRREAPSLEVEAVDPPADLLRAAEALAASLDALAQPVERLAALLHRRLDEEADDLDTPTRLRLETASRSLRRRALAQVVAWRDMLRQLAAGAVNDKTVDWCALDRIEGRDLDVALKRHWIDPTEPLAEVLLTRAHGIVMTSASLRDDPGAEHESWTGAEVRTGALHLPMPAKRVEIPSPFDYPARARVFIVTDVARDDADQVAAAYRALFLAAGGGGLGLFTAIGRLRAVHRRLIAPIEAAGLNLYAQHVDPMDTGTLVDIFRADPDSCLLGTDAVRDGVDVPGRALRLIVFDRVPWPRPDILHKARRQAFGGGAYDDMVTRLRLKQAFGRLIRNADDVGVFVMLDRRLPSRLLTAFPEGIAVERCGLAEAVAASREFLALVGGRAAPYGAGRESDSPNDNAGSAA